MRAIRLLEEIIEARVSPGCSGERGAGLVEYALLVALIAIMCIAAVAFFGGRLQGKFSQVGSSVALVEPTTLLWSLPV